MTTPPARAAQAPPTKWTATSPTQALTHTPPLLRASVPRRSNSLAIRPSSLREFLRRRSHRTKPIPSLRAQPFVLDGSFPPQIGSASSAKLLPPSLRSAAALTAPLNL